MAKPKRTKQITFTAIARRRSREVVNVETDARYKVDALELQNTDVPFYPADWPSDAAVIISVKLQPKLKV